MKDTCKAIVKVSLTNYIGFPTGSKLTETVKGFKTRWGIPQCAGSIDGLHIPIQQLAMNHTDYYNQKGFYSMLVQGVVDHSGLFTDLCIGWPGSVDNAHVLANSNIYSKCNSRKLLNGVSLHVNETDIPNYLIGDSA